LVFFHFSTQNMDLPPADAHNLADDIANTPTPAPPKKTGGAVKNRKRSLSYKPRKGTNNQLLRSASLHPPNPSASTAAHASQQRDIAALATDSPEFKLTTKKEILKLLRQSQKDLAEAQNSIRQKDATIKQLTKKNDLLLQSSKAARSAARETKNHAKDRHRRK
jgi:hypothetical protein